jgi:hypothetical protein
VKQLFDSLDADCSGSLDMAELISLASSLGAVLLDREWEDVLDAIKPMNRQAVTFFEFYRWWNSASDDLLAEAKRREDARVAQWRTVAPISSNYKGVGASSKADVISKKDASSSLRKQISSDDYVPPTRLRRCTVEQLALMVGGGASDAEVPWESQQLLEAVETGDLEGCKMLCESVS